MNLIPLRNRRQDPEGNRSHTRGYHPHQRGHHARGRRPTAASGYGLSEYLDQIVDGQPVGLAE